MAGKLDRPAAPYVQIANVIRDAIDGGELRPGDLAPSVRSISREYGVAHATAYRAVNLLQSEGYLRTETGTGSVVTSEEERGWGASTWVRQARRTGKIYPPGQHAKITEAGLVPALERAAASHGVQPGALLLRRARITYRDDRPISRSVSWFAAELADAAPRLLSAERITEGTFTYIAEATGRSLGSWQDQYDPALAASDDAAALDIAEGTPVFVGRNWIYDTTGEVIEYGESVQAGRITYRGDVIL